MKITVLPVSIGLDFREEVLMLSVTLPLVSKREFGDIPQSPQLISELCQRRAEDGEEEPCSLCSGTGLLPRYKDRCQRCGGSGKVKAVYYVRMNFGDDEEKRLAALEGVRWAEAKGRRVKALMRLVEQGGAGREGGRATVVCGLRGEKMTPQRGWASPNGEHAVFWLSRALQVSYEWGPDKAGIGTIELVDLDPTLRVRSTWLWSFLRKEPSENGVIVPALQNIHFRFPEEAVQAVVQKARTVNCREPLYSAATR